MNRFSPRPSSVKHLGHKQNSPTLMSLIKLQQRAWYQWWQGVAMWEVMIPEKDNMSEYCHSPDIPLVQQWSRTETSAWKSKTTLSRTMEPSKALMMHLHKHTWDVLSQSYKYRGTGREALQEAKVILWMWK